MRRSHEEILEQMKILKEKDIFPYRIMVLARYLPEEILTRFYEESLLDKLKAVWQPDAKPVEWSILTNLAFAWDHANKCQDAALARMIQYFRAWLWLDKCPIEDQWVNDYCLCAKPQFVLISEIYDFDWRARDSGVWHRMEDEPISDKEREVEIARVLSILRTMRPAIDKWRSQS